MMHSTRPFVTALLAAVCLAPGARGQQKTAPKPIKIAVVNLADVFDRYYKKKEFDAMLRAERAKKFEVIKEKKKEINKLSEEVQLFDLGTDARKRSEERLYQKKVEFEVYRRLAQEEFARSQREYTKKLFEDIRSQIADYAKKHGIDIVLKVEDSGLSGNTLELVQLEIKIRQVLYASPTLDITDAVVAAMNAGHESANP